MEEFPSNSSRAKSGRTARTEQPAVAPKKAAPLVAKVVQGEVVVKKKSLGKKIKDMFLDNSERPIGEYLAEDIFVPALKDLVYDVIVGGAGRRIYGDGARPSQQRGGRFGPATGRVGNTNYGAFAQQPVGQSQRPSMSKRARATHDFGEILIPSRPEAEAVLDGLFAMLDQYGEVTVSTLYELVGISGQFTDERWGWTNLLGSRVEHARNGYCVLSLPPVEVLER